MFPIEIFNTTQQTFKKIGKLKFWKGMLFEIFQHRKYLKFTQIWFSNLNNHNCTFVQSMCFENKFKIIGIFLKLCSASLYIYFFFNFNFLKVVKIQLPS